MVKGAAASGSGFPAERLQLSAIGLILGTSGIQFGCGFTQNGIIILADQAFLCPADGIVHRRFPEIPDADGLILVAVEHMAGDVFLRGFRKRDLMLVLIQIVINALVSGAVQAVGSEGYSVLIKLRLFPGQP